MRHPHEQVGDQTIALASDPADVDEQRGLAVGNPTDGLGDLDAAPVGDEVGADRVRTQVVSEVVQLDRQSLDVGPAVVGGQPEQRRRTRGDPVGQALVDDASRQVGQELPLVVGGALGVEEEPGQTEVRDVEPPALGEAGAGEHLVEFGPAPRPVVEAGQRARHRPEGAVTARWRVEVDDPVHDVDAPRVSQR